MRPRDLSGMIGVAGAYAFLPFVDNEEEIFGNDAAGRYDSQPINFISGDEPPMLLLQGDDDDEVPLHNAQIMAERAQAMDGTAELKIYPGVGHSSIMLSFARGHASQVRRCGHAGSSRSRRCHRIPPAATSAAVATALTAEPSRRRNVIHQAPAQAERILPLPLAPSVTATACTTAAMRAALCTACADKSCLRSVSHASPCTSRSR